MSELKVNVISEVTGANGVVIDSTKLKDGGVIIADDGNIGSASDTDAIAIASNGVVTFSQATTFSGAITSNAGVVVDNITIDGTEIDLSSGDLTLDVAGDIILDADGGDVKINDGGTAIAELTNSSTDFVIKSVTNDKDIIFKGVDNSSAITALTLDMSAAGAATFNNAITSGAVITSGAGLVIADTGNIGSASDTDAIAIAANGVVTFSQAPVFPDGSIAVADLDIDGATDIGAAIVDADLFVVDDGAGGTNRKTVASRLKTYIGNNTPAFQATMSGSQSYNNSTSTKVDFDTEQFDTAGAYDHSTNQRFTVPSGQDGKYFIYAKIFYDDVASTDKNHKIHIYKNGSNAGTGSKRTVGSSGRDMTVEVCQVYDLSATDYIEIYLNSNAGNGTINGSANNDIFGGFKLVE